MSGFTLPTDNKTPAPAVDKDALREFAAGANDHRTDEEPPPWEKYAADEKPTNSVSIRVNDHELEKLRYVAKTRRMSMQRIMNDILMARIDEMAREAYEQ